MQRLIDAYTKTSASTPVAVCLDISDPLLEQYEALEIPADWHVYVESRNGLSEAYNSAYRRYINAEWFGFIADDVVPVTRCWDVRLIEMACRNGMAVPVGGHDPDGAPHFVLGGDLVRSVGWLCLPGLDRLYIDTVWQNIAEARGVLIRVPDVVLEHHHFSNGKALMDATYKKHHKAQDKLIYDKWRKEHDHLS